MIFIYSLTQLNMLRYLLKHKKEKKKKPLLPTQLPKVTIQLPLYNEYYVVERLLKCITALEYPKNKIQIQVLDDSIDESLILTKNLVSKYQKKDIPIELITRKKRVGFKAGALKKGLETATGEFIVIFDADFMPQSNWLLNTIPYFEDSKIGVVQTRWGHLNRNYSVLTKVQAFALDAHFILEQIGRNSQNHFINFNGTAGIWRKTCIIDAGNWEHDTLTEDLDLSYRAQLKNWKFKYLDEIETMAELPISMSAIRSQQFRWNKGGAENFRKIIQKVIISKNLNLYTKINALFHLLNSSMFLNVLIISVLSVPLLFIKNVYPELSFLFNISGLFIISTLIFFCCYWHVHKYFYGGGAFSFLFYFKRFITFYSLIMGFSIHNSIAVLEGYFGKKSPFIRTPKFNNTSIRKNKYAKNKISIYSIIELVTAIYFLFAIIASLLIFPKADFSFLFFYIFLFIGFSTISYFDFKEGKLK